MPVQVSRLRYLQPITVWCQKVAAKVATDRVADTAHFVEAADWEARALVAAAGEAAACVLLHGLIERAHPHSTVTRLYKVGKRA